MEPEARKTGDRKIERRIYPMISAVRFAD